MIIVLVGASASGKTTLSKILEERDNFKRVVTYTTRPKREGEQDGIDYHFVSEERFNELISKNEFLEYAKYRDWSYGTLKFDLKDDTDTILILTPAGARALKKLIQETNDGKVINNFVIVYLFVDRRSRMLKLLRREDNIDEAYRRNLSDVGQFDCFEKEADKIIVNTKYLRTPENLYYELSTFIKMRKARNIIFADHSPIT